MRLSNHGLIYSSRLNEMNTELNEYCEISIRLIKNYSDEIFVEKLRSIKFPDYSNHTCVIDACQDFVTKFLSEADSVSPIITLRVKSNTKLWFDINFLNAIGNRDKHFKNSNCQTRKLAKAILNM